MPTNFRIEFPDFDYELPVIPGMVDQSWHNDVCPHLSSADGTITLWCDYADPVKREYAPSKRYHLVRNGPEGDARETLCESDSLDEILAALKG